MDRMPGTTDFTVNGRQVHVSAPQTARLSQVLREKLNLTGTKVGCDAGDCGACTVLLDGAPACSCMIALGQLNGAGGADHRGPSKSSATTRRLQESFLRHGAAQCGICTPGMLVAATALLERNPTPTRDRDHGRHRRRALPLHRLSQDRRGHHGQRRPKASRRIPWRPARPWAPASSGSTAGARLTAPTSSAPTKRRRIACCCAPCDRPMTAPASCSAISPPTWPTIRASCGC